MSKNKKENTFLQAVKNIMSGSADGKEKDIYPDEFIAQSAKVFARLKLPCFIFGGNKQIVYANPSFMELCGLTTPPETLSDIFDKKDLKKCAEFFTEDFALEDPAVKRVEGKKNVLKAIKGIFDSCNTLSFEAKNIYQDKQTTIIEFTLKLDDTVLTGTDIIEWQENKMKELRACLDIPKG